MSGGRFQAALLESRPYLRSDAAPRAKRGGLFDVASTQVEEAPDLCSWCRTDMTPFRGCPPSEANHAGPSARERARHTDCVTDIQSLSCQFCPVTARHSICPCCAADLGQGVLGAHCCPLCLESPEVLRFFNTNLECVDDPILLTWYISRLAEEGDQNQAVAITNAVLVRRELDQPGFPWWEDVEAHRVQEARAYWQGLLDALWTRTKAIAKRARDYLAARCHDELLNYRRRNRPSLGNERTSNGDLLLRLHLAGHWGRLDLRDQRSLSQTFSSILTSDGIRPVDGVGGSACLVRLSETVWRWLPEEYGNPATYNPDTFDPIIYWSRQ